MFLNITVLPNLREDARPSVSACSVTEERTVEVDAHQTRGMSSGSAREWRASTCSGLLEPMIRLRQPSTFPFAGYAMVRWLLLAIVNPRPVPAQATEHARYAATGRVYRRHRLCANPPRRSRRSPASRRHPGLHRMHLFCAARSAPAESPD